MSIASPSTMLLAALLAGPELYKAATGAADLTDAALRFLICVPVAAIMLAVLGALTRTYGRGGEPGTAEDRAHAGRRIDDQTRLDGVAERDAPR